MKLALGLGLCYLGYKYGPNAIVKGAAASVGAVIVAKQLPVIKDVL
jgi:hypothetical protein